MFKSHGNSYLPQPFLSLHQWDHEVAMLFYLPHLKLYLLFFFITHNCCLQIVNLHGFAIGPAKADTASCWISCQNMRQKVCAGCDCTSSSPHSSEEEEQCNGSHKKTASGLRKGIWVSGDNRGHMERAEIARHTYRIMDDVSCFMLPRSHQET